MKRISGRVLVKETNAGIPDLVVAVFDLERNEAEARDNPTRGPREPDVNARTAALLRNRLGSVLTDGNGNFDLPIDQETSQHYGPNHLPDLVVAVLAPEDSDGPKEPMPAPLLDRLLHVSRTARADAGPVEAYVIRIPRDRLNEFNIPWSRDHEPESAEREADRRATEIDRQKKVKDLLRLRLSPGLREELEKRSKAQAKAKSVFKDLSAATPAMRKYPFWIKPGQEAEKVHERAITKGVRRVAKYTAPVTLALQAPELKTLGLRLDEEKLVGKTEPEKLITHVETSGPATNLVRARWLSDACRSLDQSLKRAQEFCTDHGMEIAHNGDHDHEAVHPVEGENGKTAPVTDVFDAHDVEALVLDRVAGQIQGLAATSKELTSKRADVETLLKDIKALRLKGGPADATAFHDFHVVQVAFKHIWTQAFDENLRGLAEQLYDEATKLHEEMGIEMPPYDAIDDIEKLREFRDSLATTIGVAIEGDPDASGNASGRRLGGTVASPRPGGKLMGVVVAPPPPRSNGSPGDNIGVIHHGGLRVTDEPMEAAQGDRLIRLLWELGTLINEKYAFDIFHPNTYNFGIMTTYRQRWEPLDYQAGNLVATIPLAPGEVRKYSKRQVVKKSRAEKEIERSMSSRSEQSSQTSRAESEIMKRATTATNFKMTSHGSFNIGIGSMDSTTEFALNQEQHSASTKKDFHESTLKAAEEYRLERSLEVDTSVVNEIEQTSSGEISNPNNEIAVTYLFYELQRRYRISEHLHRARPIILVAQDVPAPHEIDEAWLIAHQWIISRVLLDDMFRPALDYLATGMAGDEVSLQVVRAHWEVQRTLVHKLEALVQDQLGQRHDLREQIIDADRKKAEANAMSVPLAAKIFTLGMMPDIGEKAGEMIEVARKAAEARLSYVEDALADAQKKLQQAASAFEQATRDYSAAMQRQYTRHVAIDQLRVHVKQNILYYMQAIWDHEPSDQRFFRLYNKRVKWPVPDHACTAIEPTEPEGRSLMLRAASVLLNNGMLMVQPPKARMVRFKITCAPTITEEERDLVDVADLDSPLGYKGNYIIFPLKESCYLTTYMLKEYVDNYFGVRDPDDTGNYTMEELGCLVDCVVNHPETTEADEVAAKEFFLQKLTTARPSSDEIIVPTGQLFIEALPGAHPVLEDFKLLHRAHDVRKVVAEVRHTEMENLRLAARLAAGEREDPEVEKRIVVDDKATVVTDS